VNDPEVGIQLNLLKMGASEHAAISWTAAWKREAERQGLEVDADYWKSGWRWINEQIQAGRKPKDID
jgi:hypothetical protein